MEKASSLLSTGWKPVAPCLHQIAHPQQSHGAFNAFVPMLATAAVAGLLDGVVGKYAEDHGLAMLQVQIHDTLANSLTDKVEVRCFAAHYLSLIHI